MAPFNSGPNTVLADALLAETRLRRPQPDRSPLPEAVVDTLIVVQALATVATVAQYLSPYPVIRKIVRQNTTGHFSYLTLLANFLNASLTTVYGFLLRDNFMILVNSFGITVSGAFLLTYQRYYPKRLVLLQRLAIWCLATGCMAHYATIILEEAHGKIVMGTAQNFLSIASFAAPLSSIRVVFAHRSTDSVPILLCVMNLLASLAWFVYGRLIGDAFISFPNGLGVLLSLIACSLFCIYPPLRLVLF